MFQGTLSAIVTPFLSTPAEHPAIDFKALDDLVEWQIASGVDGIVACGSTGEAATLSDEEKLAVIKRVTSVVKNRVPVIAGTGTNATRATIEFTKAVKEIPGIDGALVVAPYYNKPTQEGLFQHFREVAREGGLPVVVYNIPGRSVVEILPATFSRLKDVPGIVAVKHAVDSISRLLELASALEGRVTILAGDDPIIHSVLSVGGKGVISASATVIPRAIKKITALGLKGDLTGALKAQQAALPLINTLFIETNPVPAKAALKIMGKISSDAVRLPLVPVSDGTRVILMNHFKGYNE